MSLIDKDVAKTHTYRRPGPKFELLCITAFLISVLGLYMAMLFLAKSDEEVKKIQSGILYVFIIWAIFRLFTLQIWIFIYLESIKTILKKKQGSQYQLLNLYHISLDFIMLFSFASAIDFQNISFNNFPVSPLISVISIGVIWLIIKRTLKKQDSGRAK